MFLLPCWQTSSELSLDRGASASQAEAPNDAATRTCLQPGSRAMQSNKAVQWLARTLPSTSHQPASAPAHTGPVLQCRST